MSLVTYPAAYIGVQTDSQEIIKSLIHNYTIYIYI